MSNSNGRRTASRRSEDMMPPLQQVLDKRRILLTGATGFLGKVFLYLLLRSHPELERIYVLIRGDRRSSLSRFRREILDSPAMEPLRAHLGAGFDRYLEEKIVVLPGDITEEGLLTDDGHHPKRGELDAVVHCAGLVNFEASLEKALAVNTLGILNVVEFCRKFDAALLHVSTCYVAGIADGHRFEDEVPVDWCPDDRRKHFDLRREIRDARALVDRIETASHDQALTSEFLASAETSGENREMALETRRKRWVEERLKQEGLARAINLGWPNTYSYTKSLGEQLVLAARKELDVTVVRPAVIESALADPFPGWNQGVNTSAPLTYLSGEGYRFYPARADLVLDVMPVDLVAHAMVPVLAALLLKRHQPIYQLGTSDCNPLPMRRLVELTGLANRRDQRDGEGSMGKLAPHLEAVIVSQRVYDFASRTVPNLLQQAAGLAKLALGEDSARAHALEQWLEPIRDRIDLARSLVEVYRPYIQELVYTFHCKNIRALYRRLKPADAELHPYKPEAIDWQDYWINVHLPGLRRYSFPQLDLHARGRGRGPRRHKSLVELLDSAAERFGARPALIAHSLGGEESTTSFRELRDSARRGGRMLAGRRIRPGDRVLLIGENSPEWVMAFFAIVHAGAVAVPLDHLIAADELRPIARIAVPAAVLCSAPVARRLGPVLAESAREVIELEELGRPFLLRSGAEAEPEVDRKSLASLVFTSGTTGAPKGVMLTHGNFAAEVSMLARVFALDSQDVLLSLLPLHHTFEFTCGMLLPLASGATIVYPLGVDAANLSRTLSAVRPTALIGVPALWQAIHRRILDGVEERGFFFHAGFDRLRDFNRRLDHDLKVNLGSVLFRPAHAALGGRLRLAVSGGAALPKRIAEFFNDIGIRLLEGYGLTESAPVLTAASPDEPLRPGSVGKRLSGVEIKLACENGTEVGEILARGPNVMTGYYRNQAATDAVLRDGWLHTGDLGRLDSDGNLFIVGRAKEVIVDAGGNNVYIDELEEAYGHSPYLKELAVVGLKVGDGEQVAALAVPAYPRGESRRTVEDNLRIHFDRVSAGLNPHKRIKVLRFTDGELPRTRTRKIKRNEVVALIHQMIERKDRPAAGESADIEPWLVDALAQVCQDGAGVNAGTRLIEDLGLDSLALAELGEHLAVHTGRELTAEQLGNIKTVGELQQAVSESQNRPRLPSYARFAEPYTPTLPPPLQRLTDAAARRAEDALLSGWLKPRVLGAGNIPANRNVLVIANHASHVDFALVRYALGRMGDNLVVLAAKDYFFNTGLRRFIARNFSPLIPFDRDRAQLESLDDAIAELAGGRSVLMFPEGTRSPDGALHEFKSGAGYLALRGGCDILPVHIKGSFDVLGKGQLVPRRRPVEVRIGAVIARETLAKVAGQSEGAGAYRKLADFLRQAIANMPIHVPARASRPKAEPSTAELPEQIAASRSQ